MGACTEQIGNSFYCFSLNSSCISTAGGQTLQRWSLLSNSPAWNSTIDIRVVAANARSYAYLDGRRWLQNTETSELEFRLPDEDIDTECPWYNQWLWGLDDGGDLVCSYRDVAIAIVGSAAAIAERYASRDVVSCTES